MKAYLSEFTVAVWETCREMAPYLLFGFFIAGLLSVIIKTEFVRKHLGGRGVWPIIKASLLGVPLPLCSCGVLPVAASFRRQGAGKGAVVSFLISTPQTGVDSIMVTLSLLGPLFALFRPLIAFASGLFGGGLVSLLDPDPEPQDPAGQAGGVCCCEEKEAERQSPSRKIKGALTHGFYTLPRDIGRALIVGILIASVMAAIVPDDFFAAYLSGGIISMLVMMLLGIPVYVCATASVPIAVMLIAKGITPGAALVFLMTGPATNAAAFSLLWKIMGKRSALLYLLAVACCALAAGLLLDYIFTVSDIEVVAGMPGMLPGWFKTVCALVLLLLILFARLKKPVPAS